MERPKFVEGKIYHVYNRGVEKRKVFLEDTNYLRFVHDLFEFNDANPAINLVQRLKFSSSEVGLQYKDTGKQRVPLVDILVFCLMPNHFHLMLRQNSDKGITQFMRKLGTGYTNYFNKKYSRVGPLFQGKFKAKLINEDSHFIYLPHYIHLNPLDLVTPKWREKETKNQQKILNFLENYRWSSYLDYIGKKNFPSITKREFLMKFFEGPKAYNKSILEWLQASDSETIKDIILE